jgi:predicted RNase H-like nuclease (RuvC/YqgF family)
MINKERLGEIKKELELDWSDISYVVNQDDVKWLIKRVEALEEENDELAERVHKLALDWSELVDERNRYKQALEFYAHKKNYDIKHLSEDEHEIPVFKDYGEKARHALERDEN